MKKLWIINHYAGTPKHGMVFRSYYMGKALLDKNVKTTVFSSSYSHVMHSPPKTSQSFEEEPIDGLRYIWVKNFSYGKSKTLGRLFNMIYFCLKLLIFPFWREEKPDAIVLSSPSPFPFANAWLWSKLLGAKLIFEVRDIWPLTLVEMGGISKYHPIVLFMRLIEKWAYYSSDEVVSLLPLAYKHMLPSGLKKEKFHYIPNGVVMGEGEDITCSLSFPKDKFIVGYAGTIGIANHLETLVEVASLVQKKTPRIYFIIVGKGGEKEKLQEEVKRRGLRNIKFYPPISKEEVPSLLSKFDLCYLSLQESPLYRYGVSLNKLFDYMKAKKPILFCGSAGNHPVRDSGGGLEIEKQTPENIAMAIQKLKEKTPEEREKMGGLAFNYVKEFHSYEKLSEKFFQLL